MSCLGVPNLRSVSGSSWISWEVDPEVAMSMQEVKERIPLNQLMTKGRERQDWAAMQSQWKRRAALREVLKMK